MKRTRDGHVTVLFDGDVATTSELASRRRARTTVAEAQAAHRAQLVTWLVAEMASASLLDQVKYAAVAADYDKAHPGEPSLVEELCAAVAGDEYIPAVAA